jgi:hypothetical protein
LKKGLVAEEHKKVVNAKVGTHIFILITDAHARTGEKYKDNEVLITSKIRNTFFKNFLAQKKLHSLECS